MIKLKAKKSRFGIDKILGEEDNEFTLLSLLQPYNVSDQLVVTDPNEDEAERIADSVRMYLVNSKGRLRIEEKADSKYDLTFTCVNPSSPPEGDFTISFWPISLPNNYAQKLSLDQKDTSLTFKDLTLLALTPFMAIEINVVVKEATHNIQFVVKLPISNLPSNRDNVIITAIINNNNQFLRYLWLLLSAEESSVLTEAWFRIFSDLSNKQTQRDDLDIPLLEDLLRALSRYPEQKIDRINNIIFQIKQAPDADKIIPNGFDILWEKILSARNKLL